MKNHNSNLRALFKTYVYSLVLILIVYSGNGISMLHTKDIAIFVLFSFVFEHMYLVTKVRCRRLTYTFILFLMSACGLYMVHAASRLEKHKQVLTALN